MALNDDLIANLLCGDLSDIDEFEESDNNEENIDFLDAFRDMENFLHQNDLELNNLEQIFGYIPFNGENSTLIANYQVNQDNENFADDLHEEVLDDDIDNYTPMVLNWISGTWENQNYCCDIQFIPPPSKLPFSPLEYFKKCRSTMKQYNKAKPHIWGIKVFALASKSGFVHDFEFYVGKGTIKSKSTLGLSGDIIIRLCDIIPRNKNYKLCFDNWFTSYQLICNLKQFGILANVTVRINRMSGCQFKSDKELKKKEEAYDSKIDTNSGIVGCKWFDNKFVHLFSNYIGPEPTDEVQRWSTTSKTRIPVQ
ncbi:Uncharacterized protein FWK35_00033632, partial [Aphis craccivora]